MICILKWSNRKDRLVFRDYNIYDEATRGERGDQGRLPGDEQDLERGIGGSKQGMRKLGREHSREQR